VRFPQQGQPGNGSQVSERTRLVVLAETEAVAERAKSASIYARHAELLRIEELTTLHEVGRNANARMYLDFQRQWGRNGEQE
jgi:hypothetical protein